MVHALPRHAETWMADLMDPDANLREMRTLAAKILAATDAEGVELLEVDAPRLAELVEALDGWIRRGGFLPAAWQPKEKKR